MLRAWRARHSCRDPVRPWAWLTQITRNEAVRYAGHRDAESLGAGEWGTAESADGASDAVVQRLAVEEALSVLGDLDRLLLRLYYERDLSVAALAEMSGLTPGAVKVRMHRARAALRAALAEP